MRQTIKITARLIFIAIPSQVFGTVEEPLKFNPASSEAFRAVKEHCDKTLIQNISDAGLN